MKKVVWKPIDWAEKHLMLGKKFIAGLEYSLGQYKVSTTFNSAIIVDKEEALTKIKTLHRRSIEIYLE